MPRPNALYCLRRAISRFVQFRSECGFSCCDSTLTRFIVIRRIDVDWEVEALRIGTSRSPALRSGLHCIGVRTPLRSPR